MLYMQMRHDAHEHACYWLILLTSGKLLPSTPSTRCSLRKFRTCTRCSLRKFHVPAGGPDQLNRCKEAAAGSLLTCRSSCSFISQYNTMGVVPPEAALEALQDLCKNSHAHINTSLHAYEWFIWMNRVTHMNESCHTYEWVVSHAHINTSLHTYEWLIHTYATSLHTYEYSKMYWYVNMQRCIDINTSLHTYEWVVSHVRLALVFIAKLVKLAGFVHGLVLLQFSVWGGYD